MIADIKRAEAVMAVQLRILREAKSQSTAQLLQSTLDEIENLTGSQAAFCHLLNPDQVTVSSSIWSTHTLAPEVRTSLWLDSVNQRKPIVQNQRDPQLQPSESPDAHTELFRRIVVPIQRGDSVVAVLGVGNKSVDYDDLDLETVSTLGEMAWDIAEMKREREALLESEAKFRRIFENLQDVYYEISIDGTVLEISPSVETVFKGHYRQSDFIGKQILSFYAKPEERESFLKILTTQGSVSDYEIGVKASGNVVIPCSISAKFELDAQGKPSKIVGSLRNVTRRKQTDQEIRRLNRELRAISNCNQALVRATNEQTLLDDLCRIICTVAGYRMAWVGFAEHDANKTVRVASWSGIDDSYLASANVRWSDTERGRGPVGTCIRTAKTCYVQDFQSDPGTMAPWQEAALTSGYRSIIALPLIGDDKKAFGSLAIYSEEPNAFTTEEIRLLEELADNLAFGVMSLRARIERKRAETALRFTQFAVDRSTDGAQWLNSKGQFIYVNEAVSRLLGYTREELLSMSVTDIDPNFPADDWPAHWEKVKQARTAIFETQHRTKSGNLIPVEIRADFLEFDGEEYHCAFCRDIAQRKRTEGAIRTSEKRFRDIADHVKEWIWEVDATGKYTYASPVVEKILGYSPTEALQLHFYDLFHADDRQALKEAAFATFDQHLPFRDFINRNVHKNGQTVWLSTSGLPMLDETGKLLGYRGVDIDITERKRAEAEKARLEAQFQQAQKMETVGQLAGGVAHDFNNILAAIMMHLSLLQANSKFDAETQESLKELMIEAQRAAALPRQLLMFSRRSLVEPKVLRLSELVANLLKMLKRLIGENITVRFDRHDDSILVEADPGMLEQVLLNLSVNARDAMPSGGTLTIRVDSTSFDIEPIDSSDVVRTGRFACLSITDTGCGMDDATRKRIFEPFFTTKEAGKGTGLGLATAYGIVLQHKGWINVETEVGNGTTFKIFLPATCKAETESSPVPKQMEPTRGQETILLVEDEPSVRRVVAQSLRRLGYKVLEAESGNEAIALWQDYTGAIDLLLSDMVMPGGLTGLDVAEKLKKEKPNLRIIIASGYSVEIAGQSMPAKGGILYLQKPFQIEMLSKIVRESLDNNSPP